MALWAGEQQLDVRRSAQELSLVDKQEVRVEAATLCDRCCNLQLVEAATLCERCFSLTRARLQP